MTAAVAKPNPRYVLLSDNFPYRDGKTPSDCSGRFRSERDIHHSPTIYRTSGNRPGTFTHPTTDPGYLAPAQIPPATTPASTIPELAEMRCLPLARLKTGIGRDMISSKAKMTRLKRQLPKRLPTAKSGSLTRAAALTPVTNSGMEVIAERRINPTHILPTPVLSGIASP
jgi:hypothetical protein